MKKVFLLACLTAAGATAMMAEVAAPIELDDVMLRAISPNGEYAVSEGSYQMKFFNLVTGQVDVFMDETGMTVPSVGAGSCISNNGILVGSSDEYSAQYCKDGEWYDLEVSEDTSYSSNANAITPDGSRICGCLGLEGLSYDDDTLMQVPCIWNATADGFGKPVVLPHPETDFTGRAPQYITATDISADGKIIVGQVVNATGMVCYPIIYKEAADGTWSYEIPDQALLTPENGEFPTYPGDGPSYPQMEDFMTAEELAAYDEAYLAWQLSGYQSDLYPNIDDYMTEAEKEAYNNAMDKYNEAEEVWYDEFMTWMNLVYECQTKVPYVFNSMRIGADGLYYGGIAQIEIPGDSWFPETSMNSWVVELATGKCTKYDQYEDLNLTYLGNNGVALASSTIFTPSQSWVLQNGECYPMHHWMSTKNQAYADWMTENMTVTYEDYDYETWEPIEVSELLAGRAVSTPDLDVMALTVQNTWDWTVEAEGWGYIFNLKEGSAVKGLEVENNGETVIYDLQGRKLNDTVAPGIYIINGEKKVVR